MSKRRIAPPTTSVMRQRTITALSQKGGVGKTTLTSNLAFEAARLGLRVLAIDADGSGGMSAMMNAYPTAESKDSRDLVVDEDLFIGHGVGYNVEGAWVPRTDIPWMEGGAAVEGGSIVIVPAAYPDGDKPSISAVLSKPGTTEEPRLARKVDTEENRDFFDLVVIDMGGTDDPYMLSAILYAAEHVALPIYSEGAALSTLDGLESRLMAWFEATGKPINYLGGVPIGVPPNLRRHPQEREVLHQSALWIEDTYSDIGTRMLAPGIERRTAIPAAFSESAPVSTIASSKRKRRDLGTVPAALTRTLLTMLSDMRPDPDDPDTAQRVDYDVDAMTQAVLSQEMPDEWREVITGPRYYDSNFYADSTPTTSEEN